VLRQILKLLDGKATTALILCSGFICPSVCTYEPLDCVVSGDAVGTGHCGTLDTVAV
jgi:hypothetical protein